MDSNEILTLSQHRLIYFETLCKYNCVIMTGRTKSKTRSRRSSKSKSKSSRSRKKLSVGTVKTDPVLVNAVIQIEKKGIVNRNTIIQAVSLVSGVAAAYYVASHPNIVADMIYEYHELNALYTVTTGIVATYFKLAAILAKAIRTVLVKVLLPNRRRSQSRSRSRARSRISRTTRLKLK